MSAEHRELGPATVERSLLLLELAKREAARRTHKKNPDGAGLIEVLDEMGFKLGTGQSAVTPHHHRWTAGPDPRGITCSFSCDYSDGHPE